MKKKKLIYLILCLALLSCKNNDKVYKKLNVLFIIADDLTTTAVSSYGNKVSQTPNIDDLAAKGTRYTRAYCQYPVCGPSRASFLSGYYPNATQTFGYTSGRENIGAERVTWPQLFKDNGYYTARISKIYHMRVPRDIELGVNGTDDEASWTERYNSKGPEWTVEGVGELIQGNPDGSKPIRGGNVMTIVKAEGGDMVHADGKTAAKVSELIKKHKNEPFFMAVGFVRPHVPFVAPKRYFDAYPDKEISLPYNFEKDWDDIPEKGINYVNSIKDQMNTSQKKKAIAAYYATVAYMDKQVGKVLKTLKEEGLENNTIIIFTSDHGFHLGEHEFWMKVSVKEESARVPLIIKMPGKKPAICNSFVELLDLYPTIAELAGLSYSKHIQGKSLIKTLDDPSHKVRNMAFSVTQNGKTFLLRTDKWAYIQYGEDASLGIEMFDMENDPGQYTNLALLPKYLDQVNNFQQKLKQKLKEVRTNDLEIDYAKAQHNK